MTSTRSNSAVAALTDMEVDFGALAVGSIAIGFMAVSAHEAAVGGPGY